MTFARILVLLVPIWIASKFLGTGGTLGFALMWGIISFYGDYQMKQREKRVIQRIKEKQIEEDEL